MSETVWIVRFVVSFVSCFQVSLVNRKCAFVTCRNSGFLLWMCALRFWRLSSWKSLINSRWSLHFFSKMNKQLPDVRLHRLSLWPRVYVFLVVILTSNDTAADCFQHNTSFFTHKTNKTLTVLSSISRYRMSKFLSAFLANVQWHKIKMRKLKKEES